MEKEQDDAQTKAKQIKTYFQRMDALSVTLFIEHLEREKKGKIIDDILAQLKSYQKDPKSKKTKHQPDKNIDTKFTSFYGQAKKSVQHFHDTVMSLINNRERLNEFLNTPAAINEKELDSDLNKPFSTQGSIEIAKRCTKIRENVHRICIWNYIQMGKMWTVLHEKRKEQKAQFPDNPEIPKNNSDLNNAIRSNLKGIVLDHFSTDNGIMELKRLYRFFKVFPCIAFISGTPGALLDHGRTFVLYLSEDHNADERYFWSTIPFFESTGKLYLPMWNGSARITPNGLSQAERDAQAAALVKLFEKKCSLEDGDKMEEDIAGQMLEDIFEKDDGD